MAQKGIPLFLMKTLGYMETGRAQCGYYFLFTSVDNSRADKDTVFLHIGVNRWGKFDDYIRHDICQYDIIWTDDALLQKTVSQHIPCKNVKAIRPKTV